MNSYKLIIADVDGTLIAPNARPASRATARVIQAVNKIKKKGIAFSLATARSLDWVNGLISSLKITAPIILDNGARIYDCRKNKYIFESYIQSALAKKVLQLLIEMHGSVFFVDDTRRFSYSAIESYNLSKVIKIMVLHIPPKKAELIYQSLQKIPNIRITKSVSGENPTVESVHVTSSDAAKETALIYVAKYLGIQTKEIIGIGDSYNDYPLLRASGLKVAMGNAVPEIKAIADYIAPPYNKDGVAVTIEKFILNKK